jgi:hypothetical protein
MAVIALNITTNSIENFEEYRMRHLRFNVRVDIRIPAASETSAAIFEHHFKSCDDRRERQELQVGNKGGEILKLLVIRKYTRVDIVANILKFEFKLKNVAR